MERQIAECTSYKELAQTLCSLIQFKIRSPEAAWHVYSCMDDIESLVQDAQSRIDSYELDNEQED